MSVDIRVYGDADRKPRPARKPGEEREDPPPSALFSPDVDLFCASAPVLADASASPDGTHFDDDTNWLKAQVLLVEMCQ